MGRRLSSRPKRGRSGQLWQELRGSHDQDRVPKSDTAPPRIGRNGLAQAHMTTWQGADLRVCVELRAFEPLTPSMRTSAVAVNAGHPGGNMSGRGWRWHRWSIALLYLSAVRVDRRRASWCRGRYLRPRTSHANRRPLAKTGCTDLEVGLRSACPAWRAPRQLPRTPRSSIGLVGRAC